MGNESCFTQNTLNLTEAKKTFSMQTYVLGLCGLLVTPILAYVILWCLNKEEES